MKYHNRNTGTVLPCREGKTKQLAFITESVSHNASWPTIILGSSGLKAIQQSGTFIMKTMVELMLQESIAQWGIEL